MPDHNQLHTIKAAKESWEHDYSERFEHERKKEFQSTSGIPYKRVYTPLDLEERGFDYMRDLGFPGSYPYTRGVSPTMYREQLPMSGDAVSQGTPEETNKLYKDMYASGGEHYMFFFYDLPSQLGYDPDHPRAEGEVGTVGTSLVSLKDWEALLDGIEMDGLVIGQVMSSLPAIGLAGHAIMHQARGLPWSSMLGLLQNDILKEHTCCGYYIYPLEHAMRQTADVMCWALDNAPNYGPIHVQSWQAREKGATPVQEAAFVLSNASAYVQAVIERGYSADRVGRAINVCTTSSHQTFWEDIAKWRAMRRIWSRIMRERFGATEPEAMHLRLQGGPAGTIAHRQEYLNNITRTTLSTLSNLLGGVQWTRFLAPSEPFGVPTVDGLYFGMQGMRILSHETDINDVIDPLAGSYFIESLTSDFEERVWKDMETIEANGGVIGCIESGYFQRQFAEGAYKWQKAFDRGEIVRVGVNRFLDKPSTEKKPVFRAYRSDPNAEGLKIAAVQELRRRRDNARWRRALDDLKAVAAAPPSRENNVVPATIEAMQAYATIGEIADALREVWGVYQGPGTRAL